MVNYDKTEIKNNLEIDDLFQLVEEWGGEPEYTDFGFISATICHNKPGEGSHKLYYYENSGLFNCFTGCGYFDIFELVQKVADIQWGQAYDLNDAIRWIARRFGLSGDIIINESDKLEDWHYLEIYDKIQNIDLTEKSKVELKEYDSSILNRLDYNVKITSWLKEGITQEVMNKARIGFYAGGAQITIPHYDINNRFIGLRGRNLCLDDIEMYGKYRPAKINRLMYNHPLGLNLYGLNWAKDNIKSSQTAIVFESEKSVLKFMSWYPDANIAVACCGSSLSITQVNLLISSGAKNIIIAFDREGEKDDKTQYVKKFYRFNDKYSNYVNISFIYDKNGEYLNYKDSPVDKDKETFEKLLSERIVL